LCEVLVFAGLVTGLEDWVEDWVEAGAAGAAEPVRIRGGNEFLSAYLA
jgi:hypothetical protein